MSIKSIKGRRVFATVSGNRLCAMGARLLPVFGAAVFVHSSICVHLVREIHPSYVLSEQSQANLSTLILREVDDEPTNLPVSHVFRNYTFPLGLFDNSSWPVVKQRQSLPDPMQLIEEYIALHGEEALRANPDNRLFAAAYYGCPNSFGNRMHEFLDSLQWALITNRTLLYKYMDNSTCFSIISVLQIGHGQCEHLTDSCDGFLQRAEWMPSLDKWSPQLQLPEVQLLPKNVWDDWTDAYSQKPLVLFPCSRFVAKRPGFILGRKDDTLPPDWVQPIRKLYSLGPTFAYGMMFRYSFDFAPAMKTPINPLAPPNTVFSIGLHSRHIRAKDDGCNVETEMKCVYELLGNTTRPCHISLMSDRSCTLEGLQAKLGEKCLVRIADHDLASSRLSEHGPFAGAGFIQDLFHAVSTVQSAVIGSRIRRGQFRSSSTLLLELVDFYVKWEAYSAGGDPRHVTVQRCAV